MSCITNDYAECKPEKILQSWDASSDESESNSDSDEEVETITFSTWTREDKKIKKVVKSLDKDEFYKQWQQTVIDRKAHIHRKRVQMESYNNQKAKQEHGEALLHVDYSESYKINNKTKYKVNTLGRHRLAFLRLVFTMLMRRRVLLNVQFMS